MKPGKPNLNKPWLYKLLITVAIPFLFIYYNVLQPSAAYIKGLIADQNRSLYSSRPDLKSPSIKKTFVNSAALVIARHVLAYTIQYWWLLATLFILWLIYDIGLWPTVETLSIWLAIWFLYRSFKQFMKGFR